MSSPIPLPHPPAEPLLTKGQIAELDKYVSQLSCLVEARTKSIKEADGLKEKADADSARAERAREGQVEENGKPVLDLNETTLSLHIQKAESAVILSRGKYRQATAEPGRIEVKMNSLKNDFCEYLDAIITELRTRENKAWEVFARTYFHSRSPMAATQSANMAYSAKVGDFIESVARALNNLRVNASGSSAVSGVLNIVSFIKDGPKS